MAKHILEQWGRENNAHFLQRYQIVNIIFNFEMFSDGIKIKGQEINFSGVRAHHQNEVSERRIQKITSWARTMMLHQVLHWPDQFGLSLWPYALEYAVYVWNHLPKKNRRFPPMEIWTGVKQKNYNTLKRLHVWGCLAYVLDPRHQNGRNNQGGVHKRREDHTLGFFQCIL